MAMPVNLRSAVIQRWWPATQSLDLVEGTAEDVAEAVHEEVSRFTRGESIVSSRESCQDLDAAFRLAPEFTQAPVLHLILPTRSKWSVIWNNCFLCDGYDSLCWCLTVNHGFTTIHWSAHDTQTSFQPGATFNHRRLDDGRLVERCVCAGQTDGKWSFYATGEPLPEEDVAGYAVRRKRDRLNEERTSALLARLGAMPWQEEFYDLTQGGVFVIRRENPQGGVIRKSREEVLQTDAAGNAP